MRGEARPRNVPRPRNARTSSCVICKMVAKVDYGTIFSAWKTILKIKPNLQRRRVYCAIVWGKCTDFSQNGANRESVRVSEHCLLALRVIFHGWQWKMEMFGK